VQEMYNSLINCFCILRRIMNACAKGYNVKQRRGSYGSCSDSISGDRAVSWNLRSYLKQVINDTMATADNRHVLSHSGIMKIRQELERKDT
jgi:hypothetical protein